MGLMEEVVAQLMQPYFYYSVGAMLASFLAVNLVLRFTKVFSHRVRSYLHIAPLLSPLFALLVFPPELYYYRMGDLPPAVDHISFIAGPFMPLGPPQVVSVFSYTGMLCITGLVLGMFILLFCLNPGTGWLKRCGVINCTEEDFPEAQLIVQRCADRLGLDTPKLGILEDLRPNAFIAGRGRKSVIILSLGLLDSFTDEEVEAAVAHEMMHLSHGDHIFRSIAMALAAVSFFNPLAYFCATAALREREHWADTGSIKEGYSAAALEDALRKVSAGPGKIGVGALRGMNLWLLAGSPLLPKRWLSFHPSADQRIEAINRPDGVSKSWAYVGLALVITTILCFTFLTSFHEVHEIIVADHMLRPPAMMAHGALADHTGFHEGNLTLGFRIPPGPPPSS
ncbi:MAG: heat shock protein HtpX [Methanomassiliicoccales archaeon PtaU1.Bin124]|nr:MAG: heat shock protein HtpX [Methanomassiliicoccales archaeon PtaU1.Bin124]